MLKLSIVVFIEAIETAGVSVLWSQIWDTKKSKGWRES